MSGFSTQSSKGITKVIVNDSFLIQSVLKNCNSCRIYKGIDIKQHQFVNIYVKPYSSESSNIVAGCKEELRQKLCPRVIWTGTQTIAKHLYQIEVHEKLGPLLQDILGVYKQKLLDSTIYMLGYQLFKMAEKSAQIGYVCHNLDLSNIALHSDPEKTQLSLFNTIYAKKKNEECQGTNQKYNSIAAHLGLKPNFKDDIESICYILIDLYTNRNFFGQVKNKQYFQFKNNLKISDLPQLPTVLMQLFIYVRNTNHGDQINYSHWKGSFKKRISKNIINKPYQWVSSSRIKKCRQQGNSVGQNDTGTVYIQSDNQQSNQKNEKYQSNQTNHPNNNNPLQAIDDLPIDQIQFGSDDESIEQKVLKRSDCIWDNFKAKSKS